MAKMRICTKCGNSKEETSENYYVRKRGGFMSHCKTCISISYAARYAESTEEIREYNRGQYDKHKEKRQARRKALRETSWERKIKHMLRNTKQRAELKGWDFELDYEFISGLLSAQDGLCFYTGAQLELTGDNKISIDRLDSTKGYTRDNVNLVTFRVNIVKRDTTHEEFITLCKIIGGRF